MSSESRRDTRLGVSVVGAGRWGKNLVRVFDSLERAELVSVCDVARGALDALATDAEKTADFRQILSDPRIDAVIIATPTGTHAELAVAAFEAGKHVLVEKPMALSSADARRVLRAERLSGRRGMVGFVLHYHPAVLKLAQWIDGGLLGRIQRIVSERRGVRPGDEGTDAWWALAPHDVSLSRFFFGREPASVALSASVEGDVTTMNARLAFSEGRVAEISVAEGASEKAQRLVVQGTKGTAVFDDLREDHKLCLFEPAQSVAFDPQRATQVAELASSEPLVAEAAHFVDALLEGTPFRTDALDGARVVDVLEAGRDSLARGTSVLLRRTKRLEDRVAVPGRVEMAKRIAGL